MERSDILGALSKVYAPSEQENIIDAGYVQNVQVLGQDLIIDLLLYNPTLHYHRSIDTCIKEQIKVAFGDALSCKIQKRVASKKNSEPVNLDIANIGHIIAVSSTKGGVGKSTVTVNLARALHRQGLSVGILDADIYGPSTTIMLGVHGKAIQSKKIGNKTYIIPFDCNGIKLLSIGFFVSEDQAVIWRGPMASKAIKQMIFDTNWGHLDVLLLDLPPGTGDIHLSVMQSVAVSGSLVVSTPQKVAIADTIKGIRMFQHEHINVPILGIVENMSYFSHEEDPDKKYYLFGKGTVSKLSKEMGLPFFGEIPLVQELREASDEGNPIEDEVLINVFDTLADRLIKEVKKQPTTEKIKITNQKGC